MDAPDAIFQATLDVCVLFHAIMPVQFVRLLETVPSLGMQFANDCIWLSHECLSSDANIATKDQLQLQHTSHPLSWSQSSDGIKNFSGRQTGLIFEVAELLIALGLYWRERQQVSIYAIALTFIFIYLFDDNRSYS